MSLKPPHEQDHPSLRHVVILQKGEYVDFSGSIGVISCPQTGLYLNIEDLWIMTTPVNPDGSLFLHFFTERINFLTVPASYYFQVSIARLRAQRVYGCRLPHLFEHAGKVSFFERASGASCLLRLNKVEQKCKLPFETLGTLLSQQNNL